MRSPRFLLPLLAPALLAPALLDRTASADEVHLQGGTVLQGVVLAPPADPKAGPSNTVRLLVPGGDVLALARADVKSIDTVADAPAKGKHLRYVTPTEDVAGGLDIAVTYYMHPDGGPRIDLVGAVHIGEKTYYRQTQRMLDRASIVLYEGVKPKDSTAADFEKPQAADKNPLRALQGKIATWFGLEFQLDGIDYTRPHFVHADLTAEEFTGRPSGADAASGDEDDASDKPQGGAAKLKGQANRLLMLMNMFGPMLDLLMGDATRAGPARNRLKGMFAQTLGSVDVQKQLQSFAPGMSELLLTKRNAVVIKRLQEQREKKGAKSIAVFYGAAHMTGIEDELTRLGYERVGAEWLRAWHVE